MTLRVDNQRKCPVCGGPVTPAQVVDEGRILAEDVVCPEGCWEYHFEYGRTEERVGKTWHCI